MGRLRLALATVCACAALTAAAPAMGATPVQIADLVHGTKADIAVSANGTAHIGWLDSAPNPAEVEYCQLARGAAGPSNCEVFTGPLGSAFGRAHVFLNGPNDVYLAHARCCGSGEGLWADRSLDGGLTFPGRSKVADGTSPDEAVFGPGVSITTATEVTTAGTIVQNGPAMGGPEATTEADISAINAGAAIGLDSSSRPVAVYQVQSDPWRLAWRRLADGQPLTPAAINNPANWTAEQVISADRINAADGPALAGGPNGLFVFWQQRAPDTGWVQKFTGTGWTAPVKISDGRPFNDHDLFQDAAGRLHAVWNNYNDGKLRYSSSDDGVNWSAPVDLARGDSYPHVRVAAAADHQGFAVWSQGTRVMAVPLEGLPGPGGGGGPDTTGPGVSGFGIGDSTLTPGQGTTFTFTTTEAGLATLTIEKRVPGLKLRQRGRTRCLPQTRARLRALRRSLARRADVRRLRGRARSRKLASLLRRRRCRAWKRIGRITQTVTPGRNTIVFNGRVAGRRLTPGRYRARLVIRDSAGNVSRTETVIFRVVRPRRGSGRRGSGVVRG